MDKAVTVGTGGGSEKTGGEKRKIKKPSHVPYQSSGEFKEKKKVKKGFRDQVLQRCGRFYFAGYSKSKTTKKYVPWIQNRWEFQGA